MPIMLFILVIISTNVYAHTDECLTVDNIQNTNIIYTTQKELDNIRQEYQEYMSSIKNLPSAVKFGKSGKLNHIKDRQKNYKYQIALKYQQLEQYKYIAMKNRKIIVMK